MIENFQLTEDQRLDAKIESDILHQPWEIKYLIDCT